jgi:long-chain fatty acid transport protein
LIGLFKGLLLMGIEINSLKKKISYYSLAGALFFVSYQALASDFSLPFVNAAGLGDLYADWASSADDASTAYTNPAGLVRLTHQELVLAALGINSRAQFTGTTTPPFPPSPPQSGQASSSIGVLLPSFYYALPISNKLVVSFSQTVPFGLGTSYAKNSIVRYAATRSQVAVIDVGPSLGYKITDKFSAGLGIDFQRLAFTLNSMVGPPLSVPDAEGQNTLTGWGYGWHGGLLYQFTQTKLGFSYNSMVMFHTSGYSQVFAPVGNARNTNQRTNAALPARAQLSVTHNITPRWAMSGTMFYTNWRTLQQLTMRSTVFPGGGVASVTIPLQYHNTFDYSIGGSFKANEKWLLRAGVEFMNTPSNNRTRSVVDPIGCATLLGIGVHYQQNRVLGYDIGYAHGFFQQTPINLVTPLTTASGHSNASTNIFGGQLTWNMA